MIALPPLFGGMNVTLICPFAGDVAVPMIGAAGAVTSVTELLGDDAGPVPLAFVAVTVNVYGVPPERPDTTSGEPAPVAVSPPGLLVTV